MKTKNMMAYVAAVTLIATSAAFAQGMQFEGRGEVEGDFGGQPPRGPGGRMMQNFQGNGEGEFEGRGMMGRPGMGRPMMATTTMMMNASGTPGWAPGQMMKNFRDDMRGRMASLTDAQMTTISAKLGITVDELKAKLATGTSLREIIGNKISREEMMQIMPMMFASTTASGTRPGWGWGRGDRNENGQRPQGFINSLRNTFMGMFGGNNQQPPHEDGDVNVNADVNANVNVNEGGFAGFFKRLFNF